MKSRLAALAVAGCTAVGCGGAQEGRAVSTTISSASQRGPSTAASVAAIASASVEPSDSSAAAPPFVDAGPTPKLPEGVNGVSVLVITTPIDSTVFAPAMAGFRECWVRAKNADPSTPSSTNTEIAIGRRAGGAGVEAHLVRTDGSAALGECVRHAALRAERASGRFTIRLDAATYPDKITVADADVGLDATAAIAKRLPEVSACRAKARSADPFVAGSMTLFVWVAGDGHVAPALDTMTTNLPDDLRDCVLGSLSKLVVAPSSTDKRHLLLGIDLGAGS